MSTVNVAFNLTEVHEDIQIFVSAVYLIVWMLTGGVGVGLVALVHQAWDGAQRRCIHAAMRTLKEEQVKAMSPHSSVTGPDDE